MTEQLTEESLRRALKAVREEDPTGGKPWAQRRGSEAVVSVVAGVVAAISPLATTLLDGRPLTSMEVVAGIGGVTVIATAYLICRTWLKVERGA